MIELYTLINSIIEPLCTTYAEHYPTEEKKVYPYVEFRFPNILINNEFSDNNILEIDIWDNKDTDINEIETITDAIHKALNRFQYNSPTMNASINRNTPYRLELADPIIEIQRRQLRYLVTTYTI